MTVAGDDDAADPDSPGEAPAASAPGAARKPPKPIELGSPFDVQLSLKLQLPANFKSRTPVPIAIKRDYAEYRSTYKVENQNLSVERFMTSKMREVSADRRSDYLAFQRTILADEAQKFFVESLKASTGTPELPKDISTAELLDSARDAMQSQNYKVALDLLNRAATKEPKNKNVWNMLGDAHAGNREWVEAEKAYRRQITNDAFDPNARNRLGFVLRVQHKNQEAIDTFKQQLEINPLDRIAHAGLGELYFEEKDYQHSADEMEKAVSLEPTNAFLHASLGRAYLNLNRNKEALEAFDKAVELMPNPVLWNNIAYEMAKSNVNLDRAEQYAESAVAQVASSLRNISIDHLSLRDMAGVSSLGSYWDTLGWVAFKKGDMQRAEKFITASWKLCQVGEVGDHLAQIYEKKGRKEDAIRLYAEALTAERPLQETRERLATLVGDKAKVDLLKEKYRLELQADRTFKMRNPLGKKGDADFFVVLTPGRKIEAAKFISGASDLEPLAGQLKAVNYGEVFPDDSPTKIVRRGVLSCNSSECLLVLMVPETITTVN